MTPQSYNKLDEKYEALRCAVARFLAHSPNAWPDDNLVKPLWDLAGDFTDADIAQPRAKP